MTKNTIKKASLKFNYMAITQRPTEKTEVLSQNFQLLCWDFERVCSDFMDLWLTVVRYCSSDSCMGPFLSVSVSEGQLVYPAGYKHTVQTNLGISQWWSVVCAPVQRRPLLTDLYKPHTTEKRTFSTHLDSFATWANAVYFLICLILWCKCGVLLWHGGGGFPGVSGGIFRMGLRRRSSIGVSVTFSPFFYLLLFVTEKSSGVLVWRRSQAHSWLCSVRAVVFYPNAFLLQQYDACLVLADSHVDKCIYVYTCAIHAIGAIYYCDYYWQ